MRGCTFLCWVGGSVNSALSIGCVNFANKMYNWKKNLAWMHNFMLGTGRGVLILQIRYN